MKKKIKTITQIDNKGEKVFYYFDINGNCIRQENYNKEGKLDSVILTEYLDRKTIVRFENEEIVYEYDEHGNLIKYSHPLSSGSEPFESYYEYDQYGNKICTTNNQNDQKIICINEYDDNGNLIHELPSEGFEHYYRYDEKGYLISSETCSEESENFKREYENNDNGDWIHIKDSDGYEAWREFNEYGNEIRFRSSDGLELNFEYSYYKE